MDYLTASRLVSSWLVYTNRTFYGDDAVSTVELNDLPFETAHVEITFQHKDPPSSEWTPVCG